MRVLNILFDDRYSGPVNRVIQVAEVLHQHGAETILCLPDRGGNGPATARKAGVPVRCLVFERIPRLRDPRRVFRWIMNLPRDVGRFVHLFRREQPDAVHVNGAFFLAPAVAAKIARIPLVWHLNDTVLPSRVAPLFGAVVRLLADRIVVAAEAVAVHYAVNSAPHEVIYAPVNTSRFNAERPEERDKTGAKRVGLIGNWNPLKGLEYFVHAAAIVRDHLEGDLEVVLAGAKLETNRDYARRVDNLVQELGLDPIVRDYGFVVSIEEVLRHLDVLVLSSTAEASPMAVLEAMAAGVPVVATDVGGVRELLGDGENMPAGLIVQPKKPERIAEAVLWLLENPEKAAVMGCNGRRRAKEQFSLEICARQHMEVYKDLLTEQ